VYLTDKGDWRLTTDERKRILINNIYGVDIDTQAVEVTKLSLLLKVLEGEDEQSIGKQMSLFQERVLPDLENNIKCGNSLIGPDFYDHQQMNLLEDEEIFRVNAFDWQTEFADIMSDGGFDAVIGNPPYVRQEGLGDIKPYFLKKYNTYHGIADLYVYFIEKSISLLSPNGLFSIIVSNKWLRANYGAPLRSFLKEQRIEKLIDFGDLPVFEQATTYPSIIIVKQTSPSENFLYARIKDLTFLDLNSQVHDVQFEVQKSNLDNSGWALVNQTTQTLLDKMSKNGIPLGKAVDGKIFYGIKTGLNEAFIINSSIRDQLIKEDPKSKSIIKPFLMGKEIKRYQPLEYNNFLILIPKGWTNKMKEGNDDAWKWLKYNYPAIASYLLPFAEKAQKRYDKGDYWWEFRACDYYDEFEKSKILLPDISLRGNFTLDNEGVFYCVNTAYIISSSDKYLIGILNSSLITFFYKNISSSYRGGYLRFIYQYLKTIPIYEIDYSDPKEKMIHGSIVESVSTMNDLKRKIAEAKSPQEKTMLDRQIASLDRQIDQLVYQLYGLTDEEIKIVEPEVQ